MPVACEFHAVLPVGRGDVNHSECWSRGPDHACLLPTGGQPAIDATAVEARSRRRDNLKGADEILECVRSAQYLYFVL